MPIFIWPTWVIIVVNIFLWLFIHLVIAKLSNLIPLKYFKKDYFVFKTFRFERTGRFYELVFGVKKWKKYLPDGAKIFKGGFEKKALKHKSSEYIERFIMETKRAELSHFMQILPVPIFFLFNVPIASIIMVIYAFMVNAPCMIVQRYNRPRLRRLLARNIK